MVVVVVVAAVVVVLAAAAVIVVVVVRINGTVLEEQSMYLLACFCLSQL